MRNMLVHRARRYQFAMLKARDTGIIGVDGLPQILSETIHYLPKSPLHSDIEVMRASTFEPLLPEEAKTTIAGVRRSTLALVEDVSAALRRAWNARRADPSAVPQPRRQWDNTPATPPSVFNGYMPGPPVSMGEAMLTHPQFGRRMQVAALLDQDHPKWQTFT